MNLLNLRILGVALLVALWTFGCSKPAPPPEPLPAAELPGAIQQAFTGAKPEIKTIADQVVSLVQAQDYGKAFIVVQTLAASPGLTKEQVNVLSRATLTVNNLLQEAQTKGNVQATRTLQNYQRDK